LLIGAAIAAVLSAVLLGGSLQTARGLTPNYLESTRALAYFLFLGSLVCAASALLLFIRSRVVPNPLLTWAIALTAAFAGFVGTFGIGVVVLATLGTRPIQRNAWPITIGVSAAAMLLYWWIVRRAGVGLLASLAGLAVICTFVPAFFIVGPVLYCNAFTPTLRCL
jgi:hypothetical protein